VVAPSTFLTQQVGEFLAAIEPLKDAYRNDSFSYIAVETVDGPVLIQGTLFLNVQTPTIPLKTVELKRVRAGHFYLRDAAVTREQVISQLCDGKLATPKGELRFPANDGGQYAAQFQPYHEIGLRGQRRLTHLSLLGAETRHFVEQPKLDWEIRSSSIPYDGLQDLLHEFRPGDLRGVNCVEVAAFNVVEIDLLSVVKGETATLVVRASSSADENKVSVGVRVLEQGRVVRREQLLQDAFVWESKEGFKLASTTLHVSLAAVVHGLACYNGVAQHHYYFGDPRSFQNPRRAGYEAFDPKLSVIKDTLGKAQTQRPESRDFEASMLWLFWMLGFAPAHIGGLPRTGDAPDFIVSTPNGNMAVVECTVGLLKEDSKLPKLHDRTQAVRRNLEISSTRHVRVLPVIITAKLAEEARPDMEQAEKLGIYVITREEIERLMNLTLFPQNADQLYEQAEQATRSAKEAREGQTIIPISDPQS
jgi:hypothetical protein